MKYKKPEILVIGDASRVINSTCNAKSTISGDNVSSCTNLHGPSTAAYDLDE
jgi:hypothetical protein